MRGLRVRLRRHRGDRRRRALSVTRTCALGDAWFAERAVRRVARVDGREVSVDEAADAAAAILRAGAGAARLRARRRRASRRSAGRSALAEALGAVVDPAAPRRGARLPGDRREHGDVRRDPRPRRARGRRGGPTRPSPTRACWSGCASIAAGRSSSSTRSAPPPPRRPTRSSSSTRRATSRRCGRCARCDARRRAPIADALAARQRLRAPRRLHPRRARRARRAGAGLARARPQPRPPRGHARAARRRQRARRRGRARLADRLRRAGELRPRPSARVARARPTLLERGDVDAALVVAADRARAAAGLRELPTVVIDARDTETARRRGWRSPPRPTASRCAGTVHRMDGVPLPLRAPLAATGRASRTCWPRSRAPADAADRRRPRLRPRQRHRRRGARRLRRRTARSSPTCPRTPAGSTRAGWS